MNDLIEQVERLSLLDLSHGIPHAQVGPVSLNYVADFDSNFEDYPAYCTGMSKFLEEALTIKKVNEIVREGLDKHCSLLYTWRSIAMALPALNEDNPQKMEAYKAFDELLTVAVAPLFDLYRFVRASQAEFSSLIDKSCKSEAQQDPTSNGILMALGRMLDMLSMLDLLRNAKTTVKNDLANFKRMKTLLKSKYTDENSAENMASLSYFLAQPNEIMVSLKAALDKIPDASKIVMQIIVITCDRIDDKAYISPDARYELLRTILAALYLISTDKNVASKLEQNKVPLSRIDRILREVPAIPLIGDMHIHTSVVLKRLGISYDWSLSDSGFTHKMESSFNMSFHLDTFETDHISVMSGYSMMMNSPHISKSHEGLYDVSPHDATILYSYMLKSLKCIGKWNYTLQESFFYKMSHPADRSAAGENAETVDNYSLATRYNYSPQEKSAISRTIFFIKSATQTLRSSQTLITTAVNMHIYNFIQDFVNTTLADLHKKAIKSKNHLFKMIIESLKLICADRVDLAAENVKLKKGEKNYVLRSKSVPPLSTQIYMTVTMLNALLTMKDTRKLIDSNQIAQIQTFFSESAYFAAMIDLPATILECSQLSPFWFKEFYIEFAAGKHIQYPIEDSYAWIMVDYLVNSNEPNLYEFILYCTSIYDDAGHFVLHHLRRRHLYDEINAEAQLAFQQLSYHLAVKLYAVARGEAFTRCLNKSVKNQILKRLSSVDKDLATEHTIPYQSSHQILNLCKQRSIQYLGSSIDINSLLSQRLLLNLKKSIEAIINYFEISGLEYIVIISALLDVYSVAHSVLLENFDLPPMKIILNEINGDIPGYMPRLTCQVISLIINDVIPNYSYCLQTQRFIKSPISYTGFTQPTQRLSPGQIYGTKAMANAFEDYYSLYSKYIGLEHLQVIFKLVGYSGVARIIEDIKTLVNKLLDSDLKEYIVVVGKGMPLKCILPRAAYGFHGVVEYYNTSFESIIRYSDLRQGVLHNLRVLGNCITMIYLLEKAIYASEAQIINFTSALSGVMPTPCDPHDSSFNDKVSQMMSSVKFVMVDSIPPNLLGEKFHTMLKRASLLNQERLCCGLSFFTHFLEFLQNKLLSGSAWKSPEPSNGVISLEECTEFHRLFSVITYCLVIPHPEPSLTFQLEFGDGILFAGLAIIDCLGQTYRYEALDFISHAISICDMDQTPALQNMSYSTGTLRGTLAKKSLRESMKTDLSEDNKKILSRMRLQDSKRVIITNMLRDNFTHRNQAVSRVVKCFHPPVFTP